MNKETSRGSCSGEIRSSCFFVSFKRSKENIVLFYVDFVSGISCFLLSFWKITLTSGCLNSIVEILGREYFVKFYALSESEELSMANEHNDQIRIVQETVAGKEITFAHVMGGPAPIIYQKLGLNPQVDYRSSAIGIMNMTPSESAVIASDIAVKSGNVYLGFADRFTGTLIITGEISDVQTAMEEIVDYFRDTLGYVVCNITKR